MQESEAQHQMHHTCGAAVSNAIKKPNKWIKAG